MFSLGNMFGPDMPRGNFASTYKAYSVMMLPGQERQDVDRGGKIIMPPSALDNLTRLNIQYPMLFKLKHKTNGRETHCGVLEFIADEGRVYLPHWMMQNLLLEEGDLVFLENTSLPVATFAKFQPQHPDFLDITNAKAVLENALRMFACLTTGDIIAVTYNDKLYEFCVQETKPGPAVSIIECDMNVDFSPPVGYQEPQRVSSHQDQEDDHSTEAVTQMLDKQSFKAFGGSGNRLDGKKHHLNGQEEVAAGPVQRGIPNYNYKKGKITFIRSARSKPTTQDEQPEEFSPFSGSGKSLRNRPNRN